MESSEVVRALRAQHFDGGHDEVSTATTSRLGPSWLEPLLSACFFTHCPRHAGGHKSECNMFCIDCEGDALCSYCTSNHQGHRILQIRRSSYHDVVRVADIQKLLDVSHIQVYVINSARIVFLNGRPQSKPAKGSAYVCRTCHRSLLDASRYCSLGCKLEGIRRQIAARRGTATTTMMAALSDVAAGERGGGGGGRGEGGGGEGGEGGPEEEVSDGRGGGGDEDWARSLTLQLGTRDHHHYYHHHHHHHHYHHNGYQRMRNGGVGVGREGAVENPAADEGVSSGQYQQQLLQYDQSRQMREMKPCESEESEETSRKVMNWRKRVLPPWGKAWGGNVRGEDSGEGREECTEGEVEGGEVEQRLSYVSIVPPSTPPQLVQDDRRVGFKRRKGTPHRAPLW